LDIVDIFKIYLSGLNQLKLADHSAKCKTGLQLDKNVRPTHNLVKCKTCSYLRKM